MGWGVNFNRLAFSLLHYFQTLSSGTATDLLCGMIKWRTKGWRRLNHFQDLFKKLTSELNYKNRYKASKETPKLYIKLMVNLPLPIPPTYCN